MLKKLVMFSLSVLVLTQCSPPGGQPPSGSQPSSIMGSSAAAASEVGQSAGLRALEPPVVDPVDPGIDRPGLATAFGKEKEQNFGRGVYFTRGAGKPSSVSSLFYNDAEGIEQMKSGAPIYSRSKWVRSPDGLIRWGIKSGWGMLSVERNSLGSFVEAKRGKAYSIIVENLTENPVEVVISVDGLDVIDGRDASLSKKGYIVSGEQRAQIDGFRTGLNSVAEFRFSSVRSSYAALKHGKTRNVGVIGVAAYESEGVTTRRKDSAGRRKASAFATAP